MSLLQLMAVLAGFKKKNFVFLACRDIAGISFLCTLQFSPILSNIPLLIYDL